MLPRTSLVIPGMCDEGPPPYAELETDERVRIRREMALSKLEENRTYCVHFSSIREILTSQDLQDKISSYPDEARVHIEYFHEIPAGTAQDPRDLWPRKINNDTDGVTITNSEEDPWDTDILLFLPDGATPVNTGPDMLEIYVAMVIDAKARERDFSDRDALDRCKEDIQIVITYVLGRIEAAAPPRLDEERKHRLTMIQLKGECQSRCWTVNTTSAGWRTRASTWIITPSTAPTRHSTKWASHRRATSKWRT